MTRPLQAAGNRYLTKIIDGLPRYNEILALAKEAQDKLNQLAPAPAVPAELDPFAVGQISDEWIDVKISHSDETQRLERRRGVLLEVKRGADAQAATILQTATDVILAALHTELDELLDEAADIAEQLGTVNTAEQAVAADAAPAWKRLTQLANDYDQLRAAQQQVMLRNAFDYLRSAQPADAGEPTASDLVLANLDDVWPSWRNPGQGSERVVKIDGSAHRYEPWPTDRTELLLWLATSSAEAWIPTTPQLDALWRRRRERMNPSPKQVAPQPGLLNKPLQPKHDRVASPIRQITRTEEDAHV